MPSHGKLEQSAARTAGSEALARLRRGEITLDAYLDLRADEATQGFAKLVPKARLDLVRNVLREALENDPALREMVRQATGIRPEDESTD